MPITASTSASTPKMASSAAPVREAHRVWSKMPPIVLGAVIASAGSIPCTSRWTTARRSSGSARPRVQGGTGDVVLVHRQVEERSRLLAELRHRDVGHDPDDLAPGLVVEELDATPERIGVGEEAPGEGLADHTDRQGILPIGRGEVAAAEQRDPHHLEVLGRDRRRGHEDARILGRLKIGEHAPHLSAAERIGRGDRRGGDARDGADAGHRLLVEDATALGGVAGGFEVEAHHQEFLGLEPGDRFSERSESCG